MTRFDDDDLSCKAVEAILLDSLNPAPRLITVGRDPSRWGVGVASLARFLIFGLVCRGLPAIPVVD